MRKKWKIVAGIVAMSVMLSGMTSFTAMAAEKKAAEEQTEEVAEEVKEEAETAVEEAVEETAAEEAKAETTAAEEAPAEEEKGETEAEPAKEEAKEEEAPAEDAEAEAADETEVIEEEPAEEEAEEEKTEYVPEGFTAPEDLEIFDEFLPDPFVFLDGTPVENEEDWAKRADELKEMAYYYEYGYMPDTSGEELEYELSDWEEDEENGIKTATLSITVSNGDITARPFTGTVNVPLNNEIEGPYPVVVSMFWSMPKNQQIMLAEAGYATIILNTPEVCEDNWGREGAFNDLYPFEENGVSSICAWSWGCSEILNALEAGAVEEIDPESTGIHGFSRYGKTTLACALYDDRWDVIHIASSGAGGVATYRVASDLEEDVFPTPPWAETQVSSTSNDGTIYAGNKIPHKVGQPAETTEIMRDLQERFGYQFSDNFSKIKKEFSDPKYLPYDHHELVGALAPRAVLVTFGINDWWCGHESMFVGYYEAQKIYDFLGVSDQISVHPRSGGHHAHDEDALALINVLDHTFRDGELDPALTKEYPYEPSNTWDTIRIPGSPDEVTGLRSVKYIVSGFDTVVPVSVKAINSEERPIVATLYENDEELQTITVEDGAGYFDSIVPDEENTYYVIARFEDEEEGIKRDIKVTSIDTINSDYTAPQAPEDLFQATVDVERDNQTTRLNTGNPCNNGRYVLMFKTRVSLAKEYSIILNGVPCKVTETDNDGVFKVSITFEPEEEVEGPLVAEIKGVVFPNLFPGYSFDFAPNAIKDISDHTSTVTFDLNGASTITVSSEYENMGSVPPTDIGSTFTCKVNTGDAVEEPSVPEYEGHVLQYWALDGEEYNFSTPVEEDITLTAIWDE